MIASSGTSRDNEELFITMFMFFLKSSATYFYCQDPHKIQFYVKKFYPCNGKEDYITNESQNKDTLLHIQRCL